MAGLLDAVSNFPNRENIEVSPVILYDGVCLAVAGTATHIIIPANAAYLALEVLDFGGYSIKSESP
jgi:hypothetical protein